MKVTHKSMWLNRLARLLLVAAGIALPAERSNAEAPVLLFVNREANSAAEKGSAHAPYRTITRALERAREIRYGCPAKGIVPSDDRIVILVKAGKTPYTGSFASTTFDPTSSS